MVLQIHTDAEIRILIFREVLEKTILSLVSNQLRRIFDDLYQDRLFGWYKLGSTDI